MAPIESGQLLPRIYCTGGFCYNSAWGWWGRWVFMGIIIAFGIFVFLLLACCNSRRRRRRGLQPMYGTGWMAPGQKYSPQNNPSMYSAPPQYAAASQPEQYAMDQPYPGQIYQGHHSYYGGQQEGVQAPPSAYYPQRSGGGYYEPTSGVNATK